MTVLESLSTRGTVALGAALAAFAGAALVQMTVQRMALGRVRA